FRGSPPCVCVNCLSRMHEPPEGRSNSAQARFETVRLLRLIVFGIVTGAACIAITELTIPEPSHVVTAWVKQLANSPGWIPTMAAAVAALGWLWHRIGITSLPWAWLTYAAGFLMSVLVPLGGLVVAATTNILGIGAAPLFAIAAAALLK